MPKITNLHAQIEGKEILKGVNLQVNRGELHVIMGPNGSGKSTLASILAGKEGYEITEGSISFGGKNLLEMPPEERSLNGLFLGFQYPVEIPGVSNFEFLKTIVNKHRQAKGEDPLDTFQFQALVKETIATYGLKEDLLDRGLNEGFSGGEKKQNEILQMALLQPGVKILDEVDSGVDIDALKVIASAINKLQTKETATILITHYNRLLDFLAITHVHIMVDGKIVASGGKELAKQVEEEGYDKYLPKKPLQVLN